MSNGAAQPSRQVAERLRKRIEAEDLAPGARLPAARELAEQEGVALTTAVRAVEQLRAEGLIETVRGRGSYVRMPATEFVRLGYGRYRRHPEGFTPTREQAQSGAYLDEVDRGERSVEGASTTIAERLQITAGDPVSVARYRWLAGGRPTQISTQWEPLALTRGTSAELPATPDLGQPGVIARFDQIGLPITRVTEDVRTRLPREQEIVQLELPDAVAVFEVIRTHWSEETPVETAEIIIRGDRTVIRIDQPVED